MVKQPNHEDVLNILDFLNSHLKLNDSKIAKQLGVSRSTVSFWRSGNRGMSWTSWIAINLLAGRNLLGDRDG